MNNNRLSDEQKAVLYDKATEAPYSGKYVTAKEDGTYHCVNCDQVLFSTQSQYESTMAGLQGWPSFGDLAASNAVGFVDDTSHGMRRTEVVCSKCNGHLGHLFDDPTSPTGKHYCINSCVLNLKVNESAKT